MPGRCEYAGPTCPAQAVAASRRRRNMRQKPDLLGAARFRAASDWRRVPCRVRCSRNYRVRAVAWRRQRHDHYGKGHFAIGIVRPKGVRAAQRFAVGTGPDAASGSSVSVWPSTRPGRARRGRIISWAVSCRFRCAVPVAAAPRGRSASLVAPAAAPLTSPAHHTLTGAIDRRAARLHGFGAWPQPAPIVASALSSKSVLGHMRAIVACEPDLVHAIVEADDAVLRHHLADVVNDALRHQREAALGRPFGQMCEDFLAQRQ